MAGLAGSYIELAEIDAGMTIGAGKGCTIGFELMGFERITLRFMREMESAHIDHWGIQAAMVGVADSACSIGVAQSQGTMHPGRVGPLGSHIRVACFAALSHPGIAPEGRVALVASTGNFCV